MRRTIITLLFALAALPTAAVAQLPAPPPLPPLPPVVPLPPLPTVPLPPPAPAPAPTAPLPTLPAVPAPATPAAPQTPTVSTAAGSPSTGKPSTPTLPAGSRPTAGGGPSSSGATATAGSSGRATSPKRRPSVVLGFRVPSSGRVAIRLSQIAPVCRNTGRLLVLARNGANRFRFNGRVSGRPLRDGTYIASTPSSKIRFAIVDGKPTRNPRRLAPSVCIPGVLGAGTAVAGTGVAGTPSAISLGRTAAGPKTNIDPGATDEQGPLPQVLGSAFTGAAEAAASLHPAFYLLLALAMVALAAAAVPARVLPVASAGAVLARHRAAVTLAGTLCLLLVVVAYWVTLL